MLPQLKERQSKGILRPYNSNLLYFPVDCTLLLGQDSWIARDQLEEFSSQAEALGLGLELIPKAGHHIYADQADVFNQLVRRILQS